MVDFLAGDWIPVAEAAGLLKLTKRRVLVFVKEGRLPSVRVGVQFLVRREDVLAFKPKAPGRPVTKPNVEPPARKPRRKPT